MTDFQHKSSPGLTHLDGEGRPRMVDVSGKETTFRTATAGGRVRLNREIADALGEGGLTGKGNVLRIAETAGIMGVKKTPELIPLCHAIRIDGVTLSCDLNAPEQRVEIRCTVWGRDVTGVEMEALTGVSVAALTIYDMCKALSKDMVIEGVRLMRKTGGKSGDYEAEGGSEDADS